MSRKNTVSRISTASGLYNSRKTRNRIVALGLLLAMFITPSCQKTNPDRMTELSLPQTPAIAVVDTIHDVEITDNYRWLEDGEDASVKAWADAQDAYTRDILANVPGREFISARLGELFSIGVLTNVTSRGDRYFYTKREGSTNQPILYYRRGLKGEPKALLDPNGWSDDGTVAIDWYSVSSDGALVAYGVSSGGDENSTLHIIDVDSGEKLSDTIPNARAAAIAWLSDNSGFYYTKYPTAGTVPEGDEQYYRRIYFHNMGQDPDNDPLIFGEGLDKAVWPHVVISEDNRWLIVMVFKGWTQSSVYIRDLNSTNSEF
ncbi:MAG: hypothetical protein IIB00_10750, partial [candidate division Zixibacteria bacterium]|nr:hypothetical protein [candidate division Zixibacteria bacterium]